MHVEVSIEAKGDLFPPLVSQSREKWAYEVLLKFKTDYNLALNWSWQSILLTGDSERFPVPANQSREKVI